LCNGSEGEKTQAIEEHTMKALVEYKTVRTRKITDAYVNVPQ
jgi:hypothetical protein